MPDYINDPDLLAQLEGKPARNALTAALAAEGVSGKVADIARSIYQQESGSGRNTRTSNAGAVGGMQVIPTTFAGVADKGWNINDPVQNARAGVRYVKRLFEQAGGDPALTAAGYYGGPGGLEKARRGVAVSDPRNPAAPTTLEYGQQVAARIPKERGIVQRAVESVIPSAQAAERQYIQDPELLKQLDGDVPRVEVRGTSADGPQGRYEMLPPSGSAPITRTDRFLKGMVDPIEGGAQLLTKILPDAVVNAGNQANNWLADKTGLLATIPQGGLSQKIAQDEASYQARREPGFDAMRLLGNIASPANLALAARAPAAVTGLGRIGVGAGTGAASSALNPVIGGDDFWSDKAKQVAIGAGFGAGSAALTGGMGRLISPNASTNANLALLRNEGVQPTIGQSLGGWANRIEEKATSIPILGDAISHAREAARRQFNEAAINRATAPIGVRAQGVGQGAVQNAGDEISKAYNAARAAMGSFQLDRPALADITRIQAMVQNLPAQQRRTFETTFNSVKTDISPNGTIPASVFKRIDSKLGEDAAQFLGSSDPYHQQLGRALGELQSAISNAGRRANPQANAMFSAADRAYANLVRVEGASKAAMNTEGIFTPGQLNSAVRQADKSVRDRATARGTALMQDLGNAGQQVLGNKVPNSGTADRLWLGAGGLGAGLINPAIPAGLIGGAALYTSPVQGLLRGAVSARPQSAQAIRDSLLQATPFFAPAGAQVGLGLLN